MKQTACLLYVLTLAACGPDTPPAPTCTDGVRNGDETGVDCGGACDACAEVVPRGDRHVGITISPSENGVSDGSFMEGLSESALEQAQRAHVDVALLRWQWGEIETAPGVYQDDILDEANRFYSRDGLEILLALDPIDSIGLGVPEDLQSMPLDSPEVIERYQHLLDHVFAALADLNIVMLIVGNEVTFYLEQSGEWQTFEAFYEEVGDYARTIAGVTIGTTGIGPGDGASTISPPMQEINRHSDVIVLTYYPEEASFEWLVEVYPDKPICITEIGYPSSEALDSSEEIQAAYVRQVFAAWDSHASQVEYVLFFMLHDMSYEEAGALEDAICTVEPDACPPPGWLAGYLSSIGLRTYPGWGADKLGFEALVEETAARGW